MFVQIRQSVGHGFDQPLGLLSDCHRRIEHFLSVLLTVAQNRCGGAIPEEERRVAEQALLYFRSAAPRHTADEEVSLFPRLRTCTGPEVDGARRVLDELEADHRAAEAKHAAVDAGFRVWMTAGTLPVVEAAALLQTLEELQAEYTRHIAVEEQQLFPLAGRVLRRDELESVGREMAARRGVPFRTVP
ncbi:MAG: hemerythrin domain-containing protein [Acidobacteriota bacterium]